ncbi:FCD domain-containing protein [Ochrobactrum sp. CM-21-5]|nr:FCD domain-containing protein [Ochrobactrum sp. CM-21-5]MBC2887649.1 FCD domain-containing protein [Ochrobactrum sp. CM-21-5]
MTTANLSQDDRMQLLALQLLSDAKAPTGALSLASAFRNAGIDVAEATAGRFLRQLDALGYTKSLGKRGRLVTGTGEKRLAELILNGNLAAHGARVTAAVDSSNIDELIDLLHVRRAVEAEAAGLAALRATDEEIERIEKAAATHIDCVEHSHRLELSDNFHVLLSRYSHNRLLRAMTGMLLDPVHDPLAKLLDRISDDSGQVLNMALDHKAIARAVRNRDVALTERLMRDHIDKLIWIASSYRDRLTT